MRNTIWPLISKIIIIHFYRTVNIPLREKHHIFIKINDAVRPAAFPSIRVFSAFSAHSPVVHSGRAPGHCSSTPMRSITSAHSIATPMAMQRSSGTSSLLCSEGAGSRSEQPRCQNAPGAFSTK